MMTALLDRFRLTGRVAIVTGAGRGIGAGIALGFAEAGAKVVCAARTAAQIEAIAAEARERHEAEAIAVPCDVNEDEQLEQLVARAMERFGGVDILVNNAGGTMPSLALATSAEAFEAAFHFNTTAPFSLSQKVIPKMLERGDDGVIVNISSALAHFVEKGFVAYGTAKAALSHMTRLLAYELAPRVRINALAVGAVRTSSLEPFLAMGPEYEQRMVERHPLGRIGTVEDVAAAALYLASPASSWVTGKVFEIDGGTVASTWPLEIQVFPS